MRVISLLLALLGAGLLVAAALPWPGSVQRTPAIPPTPTPDLAAQGALLFRAKGCMTCHHHDAVDGSGSIAIGPDLSQYKADPAFLRRWLADPASLRPETRMPNLELSPDDIEALIAFLESGAQGSGFHGSESQVSSTYSPASSASPQKSNFLLAASRAGEISTVEKIGSGRPQQPDPDVNSLVELSQRARELANEKIPDPVLRELTTDLRSARFLFTDADATLEVDVIMPETGAPPEKWGLEVLPSGKLTGHTGPELGLDELTIGPHQMASATAQTWPGCTIRGMFLVREGEILRWVGFCNTAEGVVSGFMDNDSGDFQPSGAPPSQPPATAAAADGQPAPQIADEAQVWNSDPPETCPITKPPEQLFRPPDPYPERAPYEGEFWYGAPALWTMLPVDGRWDQLAHGEKVWWWREGFSASDEPQPELWVTARRLDGNAPIARSGPPATNGYHQDFHSAMLIGLQVASPGCWEITGHYHGQSLSFVVWVGP
jgi:cytochrome c2